MKMFKVTNKKTKKEWTAFDDSQSLILYIDGQLAILHETEWQTSIELLSYDDWIIEVVK